MATMVKSFSIQGIDGYPVDIETTMIHGKPMISIIGLGDQAVKEAGERIEASLIYSGYEIPKKKIIISLAPGDRKKKGSHFDLAMAISLLQQSAQIAAKDLTQYGFLGELSLNGVLRPCSGVLPMVIAAKHSGIKQLIVPSSNVAEAQLVRGLTVYGLNDLQQVVQFLEGKSVVTPGVQGNTVMDPISEDSVDFRDVKGQNLLIESIVLAAAGGHNMLMIGEPGCGKSMIAKRIPTILPKMTEEEALEVTKLYSISGLLKSDHSLILQRPFRAPHHNASLNALIGGGNLATPGEVSLAHNGVLFLDELAEFSRRTLDALRQPMEDKRVTISRVNGTNIYPANFMFIAAMNPCPCGYHGTPKCRCTDYEIIKYRNKISGPILDRIGIQKQVHPVDYFELSGHSSAPSSAELRERVESARKIQQLRYHGIEGVNCNAQMNAALIREHCSLEPDSSALLRNAYEKYGYSARSVHGLLRMARTSADLEASVNIRKKDIAAVLLCRDLDKSNRQMMTI